jgi:hypothetical protein
MMWVHSEEELLLPHGLYDQEGACHRAAVLRPLTGNEEALIGGARRVELGTLLEACLGRIGGYEQPSRRHVDALTRGDRDFLALRLRRSLFGDRLSLVVTCVNPACAARADLDLEIGALAPERELPGPEFLEITTPAGLARVREPTGADDQAVSRLGGSRSERAAELWSRLLLDLDGRGPLTPQAWLELAAPVRQSIALGLSEHSSAPDLGVATACPSCAASMQLTIDPLGLLVRELRQGVERLVAEVHCLAWAYGWSEADILALPRARRWGYLDLVRRQVEGRPLVDSWS